MNRTNLRLVVCYKRWLKANYILCQALSLLISRYFSLCLATSFVLSNLPDLHLGSLKYLKACIRELETYPPTLGWYIFWETSVTMIWCWASALLFLKHNYTTCLGSLGSCGWKGPVQVKGPGVYSQFFPSVLLSKCRRHRNQLDPDIIKRDSIMPESR